MEENKITALAREYAEWVTESEGGSNAYIPAETAIASALLRWLSRRFCLVEKRKVMQIYQAKQHILANQNVLGITVAEEAAAQKRLMLCLFPEIAKEVES